MDRASQVLAQGVPPGVPTSYRALADHHSNVSHSTLHHRARRRPSREEKAQGQQYLKPYEEEVIVKYLLKMSNLGYPIQIKFIPSLAYSVTRHRPTTERPRRAPGHNWAKVLEKRHPILLARRFKALDWNRYEKNIHRKVTHWFEVIKDVLQDPAVLAENVYNMDETGVMLSMLGSVKVLVSKYDERDYRGARVKRTTVTAIEYISGNGRYLNPMIIWPASTHRSNWATFPTPGWQYAYSDSGYTDSKISLEWLKRIFDPETKERANKKLRVLICDGFRTHETLEILEFSAFAPLKAAYRDQVDRLEQGGINTIGKEHFTSLYSPTRKLAFTLKNIKAGFAVRRSTKLLVLGRAKVISYEDLEEARAKRAEKDAAKEAKQNKGKAKGKRGQKCKNATPKADEVEVDKAEADESNAVKTKRGRKRVFDGHKGLSDSATDLRPLLAKRGELVPVVLSSYNFTLDIKALFEEGHLLEAVDAGREEACEANPADFLRQLVVYASGLFIWAATACLFIREGKRFARKRLDTILQSSSSSITTPEKHLNKLYLAVLTHSISLDFSDEEKEEACDMLKHILRSTVVLLLPLSTSALSRLLQVSREYVDSTFNDPHTILDIPDDPTRQLRLHHPSFRDFIVNKDRCGNFWVDKKQAQGTLATCCIELMMSKTLKKDICELHAPGYQVTQVESGRLQQCLPPEVKYACLYWVQHLQRSGSLAYNSDEAHRFLQEHLLHWLEALGWMGRTSEGIQAILSLEALISANESSSLHSFIHDTKRFVLYNQSVIEKALLQLYCSAIMFALENSIVKRQFKKEMLPLIQMKSKVRSGWSATLQTLEGHSRPVNSVAFSPHSIIVLDNWVTKDKKPVLWLPPDYRPTSIAV
ncbi:hypothetical protein HYALB_00003595 [Hymenoscyphus albidus]|uniref:HTH CENPB-type domain-containing protein n=1 Tax=Hymenoscyphus albidus TaxID=595503 RepID=A0A9N9LVV0_9HELO|nr:hypothetical protein HYALB_00003595 [Hymenoscyphus albidus]